jgi:hypothetical protein
MEIWDRKALAFAALQRLWVAYEPEFAENQWQEAFAFGALSDQQRAPGHWYRHEGQSGYIQYYAVGDQGEFHAELPAGIDQSSIVVIPRIEGIPSIYDRIKGLLLETSPTPGPAVQSMLDDMDELRGPAHARRIKFEISSGGSESLHAGKDALIGFLNDKLQKLSTEGLGQSRITGFEVAALMLLDSLSRQLAAATPAPPSSLIYKMFDPTGVPSLPEMTARFIADCFKAGMGQAASAAFDQIRKGGDGTLAAARDMTPGDMHPGLYLDAYYAGLQQAGIRFLAVRWGWLSALMFGGLTDEDRERFTKRANSAEEKLVRMNSALMYAVQDLDGSRYREKQKVIREAREAGLAAKADAVLFNVFDSQMFYPKALRDVLNNGA